MMRAVAVLCLAALLVLEATAVHAGVGAPPGGSFPRSPRDPNVDPASTAHRFVSGSRLISNAQRQREARASKPTPHGAPSGSTPPVGGWLHLSRMAGLHDVWNATTSAWSALVGGGGGAGAGAGDTAGLFDVSHNARGVLEFARHLLSPAAATAPRGPHEKTRRTVARRMATAVGNIDHASHGPPLPLEYARQARVLVDGHGSGSTPRRLASCGSGAYVTVTEDVYYCNGVEVGQGGWCWLSWSCSSPLTDITRCDNGAAGHTSNVHPDSCSTGCEQHHTAQCHDYCRKCDSPNQPSGDSRCECYV